MRLAWLTDIHLNFVRPDRVDRLADEVAARDPDAVLVGGDVAEADTWEVALVRLADRWERPVYFVLGNHDFYHGSIAAVRRRATALSQQSPWLRWLPTAGVVPLADGAALVGHDGWGDARAGHFRGSPVLLNDYVLIDELRAAREAGLPCAGHPRSLERELHRLGHEAAAHFRTVLPTAFEKANHVVLLTHVPPFREACWHAGRLSDDDWAPHFCCLAVGEVLRETMRARPAQRLTVLCGHTHGEGVADLLPNLRVVTGGAVYGEPRVQDVLEFP
jgi:3',5'-cyclic AMP phosphodiesterase CpdA